jgi:branched-chain amino acid transport system permease protein
VVLFLILIPFMTERTDLITWFTYTLLYITLSQSWNLIGGYTGQQNLGHAAFFGIGGVCARFLWLWGVPLPLALLAGALGAVIFALIIGFPAFRLKGIYFIISTLVLAEILQILFYTVLPRANVLPSKLLNAYSLTPRYYLSLVIAVLAVVVVDWIRRSRLGLGLMSIREDEDAAEASGVNTLRYKLTAFLISTSLAGLAGGVLPWPVWPAGCMPITQPPFGQVTCFQHYGPLTRSSSSLWAGWVRLQGRSSGPYFLSC